MTRLTLRWTWGLLRSRPLVMGAMAASIALTVALVASLGSFAAASQSSLTVRAAKSVAVDWQVQVTPSGTPGAVRQAIQSVFRVRVVEPVDYARISGLSSTSATGTRATGATTVVGLPPRYASRISGEIRYLVGAHRGVLIQQQTAANLGAGPGSIVLAQTASGPVRIKVDGVVDLPKADSFFQVVGTPAGAGAAAPPDNVILAPESTFASLAKGSAVVHQFHVVLDHAGLPADPAAAADEVTASANHLAAVVAGGALVGNNLAAALSAAREDAIYARLLFLLLGLPGLALSAMVATLVVGLRADGRRRESALLLMRGASRRAVVATTAGEGIVVAAAGTAAGLLFGVLCVHILLPGTPVSTGWMTAAAVVGAILAMATQLLPAFRSTFRFCSDSVVMNAARVPATRQPWFLRLGLDFVFLGLAAMITALNAHNGYRVVVVPEGVPVTAVNYGALIGPALAWPGLIMLTWRLTGLAAARRKGNWSSDRPGRAPELLAASVRRRRQVIARGAAGLAAAIGLGVSTAIFTSTYDQQSRLDVALTVGSDVSATTQPGTTPTARDARTIAQASHIVAVQPLLHRFAYVGPDLQDLFGIHPSTIGQAAVLQNAFFPGSSVSATLSAMARTPDAVLLSAETIRDYQLRVGDTIRLRLPVAGSGYQPVPFHVVGQISEFPTAPKDSFIVANASYVGTVTKNPTVSTYLIGSSDPSRTASSLRATLGRGWQIQDITSARGSIVTASGLAATDLSALARLELAFSVALAIACTGLALGLGIVDRRRALIVLSSLGASYRERARFLRGEGSTLVAGGIVGGSLVGLAIGYLLVAILRGIFDPPPDGLNVPTVFVVSIILAVGVAGRAVLGLVGRFTSRATPNLLREL